VSLINAFAEKRPLKSLVSPPGFASPSNRLMQRDYLRETELTKGGSDVGMGAAEGLSSIGLMSSSGNEVLHYTFRPSKQIVSIKI